MTLVVSFVSLIVALGALGFSVFTYFAHDRELKRQERIINDFQLSALAREEAELKKAQIRGNIIKTSAKGGRELRIFNAGKSQARNVKVEWLNEENSVLLQDDFSDIGVLTPQNYRAFHMALCMGHHDTMKLRYTWDDDSAENNVYEEDLQL